MKKKIRILVLTATLTCFASMFVNAATNTNCDIATDTPATNTPAS